MNIRFATKKDTLSIVRSLQNKHIEYNTPTQAKEDIKNNRLVIAEENGRIYGSCAIIKDERHHYTAIKRLCVYNKKFLRKSVGTQLVEYVCSLGLGDLGATPWADNPSGCKLFERNGFEYQYTFNEKWCFYLKKAV